MSAFIDKVATVWGETKYIGDIEFNSLPEGFSVQEGVQRIQVPEPLKEYTFIMSYVQTGKSYYSSPSKEALRKAFIEGAKEELFGGLRSIERRLVQGLYGRDIDAMESALRDLHTEIY